MREFLYLAAGGIAGTFCRHFLSSFVFRFAANSFPYGTLAVNLTGCFLLGLLVTLGTHKFFLTPSLYLLLVVGFCGAFTTFSTFILETYNLTLEGHFLRACLNALGSLGAGLLFFRFGIFCGTLL